ncbi:MAG TPA: hypothetical protein VNN80_24770, partial [Polyangiaceae bacterium]|nr:hypothetical protein [Polyangiaceae bacterium]
MTRGSHAPPPPPATSRDTAAQLEEAAAHVQHHYPSAPAIGVVLGSGLGGWATRLDEATRLPYATIPHMPTPSVAGHPGELWLGQLRGVVVACLR